jgi:hypothetical protein
MAWGMHRVGAGLGPARVERRSALRALGLLALLLGLLALPPGVAAHTGVPERQERVQAGPYTLELRYYSVPRSGQNLVLMIVPVAGGQPAAIQVTAVPGAGVDAPAAAVRTAPDPDDPTATDALIPIAAPGLWVITVAATGPAGTGQAELGLLAATPGAIPVPVGWAIGLSPLIGIIGFAAAQRRWLRSVTNE